MHGPHKRGGSPFPRDTQQSVHRVLAGERSFALGESGTSVFLSRFILPKRFWFHRLSVFQSTRSSDAPRSTKSIRWCAWFYAAVVLGSSSRSKRNTREHNPLILYPPRTKNESAERGSSKYDCGTFSLRNAVGRGCCGAIHSWSGRSALRSPILPHTRVTIPAACVQTRRRPWRAKEVWNFSLGDRLCWELMLRWLPHNPW